MLISSTTTVSDITDPIFTATFTEPTSMADEVLYPSGLPTNNLDNLPLPENGEMSAASRRTSTLVNVGPTVSTPFLTREFSEKNTIASAITTSRTTTIPIRTISF